MSKLEWGKLEDREYEAGVEKGVLWVYNESSKKYGNGVAWNGLISVGENPTGAESNKYYADNIPYFNIISAEEYEGSISAYMYPDEFKVCNGEAALSKTVKGVTVGQQARKMFSFSYQSKIGNAVNPDYGKKIHIVYGAQITPSEKTYETINEQTEPGELSWDFTTTPVQLEGFKPISHIEIDSTELDPAKFAAIEELIYGTESKESELPMPADLLALIEAE